jgi:hypothetical protein
MNKFKETYSIREGLTHPSSFTVVQDIGKSFLDGVLQDVVVVKLNCEQCKKDYEVRCKKPKDEQDPDIHFCYWLCDDCFGEHNIKNDRCVCGGDCGCYDDDRKFGLFD